MRLTGRDNTSISLKAEEIACVQWPTPNGGYYYPPTVGKQFGEQKITVVLRSGYWFHVPDLSQNISELQGFNPY